jgi:hypothetical protein
MMVLNYLEIDKDYNNELAKAQKKAMAQYKR